MRTFLDDFSPRVRQAASGPVPQFAAGIVSGGGSGRAGVPSGTAMRKSREQIKHYRLWNFVAASRNAIKASEAMPNVSVYKPEGGSQAPGGLTQKQRLWLQRQYGGVIQSPMDDLVPVVDSHPLRQLFAQVNSTDWWQNFAFETYLFLGLTGAFYWWLVPSALRSRFTGTPLPAELWVIPTHWVQPEYDYTGSQVGWKITPDTGTQPFVLPLEEVLPGVMKSPLSKLAPYSPLEAGAEWVLNSEEIELARAKSLQNGPLPSVLLELDKEAYSDNPDEKLLESIGNRFMARYSGVDKAYRPVVMPPGVKAVPWGHSPKDLDFKAGQEDLRDNVLALHGVPKAIAGLAHDLNKASIFGAELIWCQHTIGPLHAFVAGALTERLASLYDPSLRVWYDDCRPNDEELEQKWMDLAFARGGVSPDDFRSRIGLPSLDTPASQKTFIANTFTPLEQYDEATPSPAAKMKAAADLALAKTNPPPGDEKSPPGKDPPPGDNGGDGEQQAVTRQQLMQLGLLPRNQVELRAALADRTSRDFVKLHSRHEANVQAGLAKFWNRVRQVLVERVRDESTGANASVDELMAPGEFGQDFDATMFQFRVQLFADGVDFETTQLVRRGHKIGSRPNRKTQRKEDPAPDPDYPDINLEMSPFLKRQLRTYLKSREVGIWKLVEASLKKKLVATLHKSIKDGESIADMAKAVGRLVDDQKRAVVIARTETTAGLNFGQQALREEEGIDTKEWVATYDGNTRESHLNADGQKTGNTKLFKVGGYDMAHPGDGSHGAPAGEIVNCRCTTVGVIEDPFAEGGDDEEDLPPAPVVKPVEKPAEKPAAVEEPEPEPEKPAYEPAKPPKGPKPDRGAAPSVYQDKLAHIGHKFMEWFDNDQYSPTAVDRRNALREQRAKIAPEIEGIRRSFMREVTGLKDKDLDGYVELRSDVQKAAELYRAASTRLSGSKPDSPKRDELRKLDAEARASLDAAKKKAREYLESKTTNKDWALVNSHDALVKSIYGADGSGGLSVTTAYDLSVKQVKKDMARDAAAFVGRVVAKGLTDDGRLDVAVANSDTRRSYATDYIIHMDNTSRQSVYVHEMAHLIESRSPYVSKLLKTYLIDRAGDANVKPIGKSYDKSEIAVDPKAMEKPFPDVYCGKTYGAQKNTELLTMGLQFFYEDPFKFAVQDPDYFDFIVSVVSGKLGPLK